MEIRGQRECKDCGTRWSYYETGAVSCPECGSFNCVGVDEPTEHTDTPAELDLSSVRNAVDTESVARLAARAADHASEYCHKRGFVHAGELQLLDETYVAAMELKHVGRTLKTQMRVDDATELYFLELLDGADEGDRPNPTAVPQSLYSARGLAAAATIEAYHRDVARTHGGPDDRASRVLGRLRDHRKRIEALDGDVPPREAERFLDATRDLGRYLVAHDESALVTAEARLDEAER